LGLTVKKNSDPRLAKFRRISRLIGARYLLNFTYYPERDVARQRRAQPTPGEPTPTIVNHHFS
jgi:hypothetical protein